MGTAELITVVHGNLTWLGTLTLHMPGEWDFKWNVSKALSPYWLKERRQEVVKNAQGLLGLTGGCYEYLGLLCCPRKLHLYEFISSRQLYALVLFPHRELRLWSINTLTSIM